VSLTGPDRAERVRVSVAAGDPQRSLRPDSVHFLRTVAISVGIQGPTAGVIVGPAILAGIVGGAGALAYLLALVAMGFVAYAFVLFSRSFNTSSSVYAYNGSTLGARYGLVSVWLLLLVYVAFAAGVYANTADIAGPLLDSIGVHIGWVALALIGWALTMLFAYLSFGFSAIAILACEGIAVALIVVVAVVVVLHGGHHHDPHPLSLSPFHLHGVTAAVLGSGIVIGFSGFSGFEGAATLGEESAHSRRTIPAAVAGSLIASAAVYILITWVVDNAYPTPAALAANPAPIVHLANVYVGSGLGKIVNAAGVISAFGAQLACINAANRLVFALGREAGSGPQTRNPLVRTSARHGSPVGALCVTGLASLIALLAFASQPTPLDAITDILTYGADLIIAVYLLTVIAALVMVWRAGRRIVPLVILAVGVLVLGYVLKDTFDPLPTGALGVAALAALVSLIVGVVVSLIPAVHRRLRDSPLLRATRS
jgi:amino acid transporter